MLQQRVADPCLCLFSGGGGDDDHTDIASDKTVTPSISDVIRQHRAAPKC